MLAGAVAVRISCIPSIGRGVGFGCRGRMEEYHEAVVEADRTCRFAGCCRHSGRSAGEDQGRHHRDAVGTRRRARPAIPRRFSARGQGARRQDGRQGRRGRRRRRRTQARRRRDQGQGPARAREGRFRGRADLLQHPAGHSPAGDREQDVPDQPERGPVELRRQGVQPVLLRDLLPERPGSRDPRQGRTGPRLQARLRAGAELSGRQGFGGRIQARLQGRDRQRRATRRSARWISRSS